MSSCPQVLCIRGCWQDYIRSRIIKQGDCRNVTMLTVVVLKTGASGQRYRKITWTVGVVEFGDRGRCIRPQNRAWASSQKGSRQHNQWKAKKWDVGITLVNEKEELLQVTWELLTMYDPEFWLKSLVHRLFRLPTAPPCARTLCDCFLLHTSIIAENKNIILYFYIYTCSSLLIMIQCTIQQVVLELLSLLGD